VYGVLGDWGTGKTSALKILEARLNTILKNKAFVSSEPVCVPIWFNAWKYENEANLVYPLLKAIQQDYETRRTKLGQIKEELEYRGHQFGAAFVRMAAGTALVSTDLILRLISKQILGDALKVEDLDKLLELLRKKPDTDQQLPGVWSDVERTLGAWTDGVGLLDQAFKDLLDAYAADIAVGVDIFPEQVRFVIIIDDLDRCLPDTVICILESIKNFLSVEGCIFVLGLNAQIVYQGISHKYHGVNVDGREYLEKILNYTFYMPEPEIKLIEAFARNRINELVGKATQAQFRAEFDTFGSVLDECKFNNPRKIKRILNRYLMFLAKYETTLSAYFMRDVVRLITIAEYFPALFQLFLYDGTQAEQARTRSKFRGANFQVEEYEKMFGLKIQDSLPQLIRLSNLFDLQKEKDDLVRHAQAVYSITRLI